MGGLYTEGTTERGLPVKRLHEIAERRLDAAIARLDPHIQGVMGQDSHTRVRRATAVAMAEVRHASSQGRNPSPVLLELLGASAVMGRLIR